MYCIQIKYSLITYDKNRWQGTIDRSGDGNYCFLLFQIQSTVQNVTPLPVQQDTKPYIINVKTMKKH